MGAGRRLEMRLLASATITTTRNRIYTVSSGVFQTADSSDSDVHITTWNCFSLIAHAHVIVCGVLKFWYLQCS
jgi:hypothetical protein